MTQNNSLLYLTTKDGPPVPADLPTNLRLSRYEIQIDFPIIIVNSSNRYQARLQLHSNLSCSTTVASTHWPSAASTSQHQRMLYKHMKS